VTTASDRSVPRSRAFLFAAVALGGLAIDLVSKAWIFRAVGPPGSPAWPLVTDILELRTTYNRGALWGFGQGFAYSSVLFAALSILATVVITYWLFVRGGARDGLLTVALALISGGALGNGFDRVVYGHVRDFMHFHVDSIGFNFAIFNFADNMLVAGAGLLMWLALRPEPAPPLNDEPAPPQSTTDGMGAAPTGP
jgi:signal peptidase II